MNGCRSEFSCRRKDSTVSHQSFCLKKKRLRPDYGQVSVHSASTPIRGTVWRNEQRAWWGQFCFKGPISVSSHAEIPCSHWGLQTGSHHGRACSIKTGEIQPSECGNMLLRMNYMHRFSFSLLQRHIYPFHPPSFNQTLHTNVRVVRIYSWKKQNKKNPTSPNLILVMNQICSACMHTSSYLKFQKSCSFKWRE